MKKMFLVLVLCVILCIASLVGCAKAEQPESTSIEIPEIIMAEPTAEPEQEEPVSEVVVETIVEEPETEPSVDIDLSDSSNFYNSTYILDELYSSVNNNVLFSPLSLNMALGVVQSGSDGETYNELSKYLGTEDFSYVAEELMTTYSDENSLNLANSIWINNNNTINNDFKDKSVSTFDADIESIDFKDGIKACETINNWCADKTNNLINQIITPESLTPLVKAVIINALYFNSDWLEPWDLYDFKFTNIDGSEVDIEGIKTEAEAYYNTDKAEAFSVRYKNGLTFIGILPKDDAEFSCKDIDLNDLLDNREFYDTIEVNMPKLKYETENSIIKRTLEDLGYKAMFSTEAGFNGIVDNEILHIDNIIQKCTIDLDEKGTEASAVTALIMNCEAVAMEEPTYISVSLDRPYMYLIADLNTNQVLFMGKVVYAE